MEIDARIVERLNYYIQKLHNIETELLRVKQENRNLKEQLIAQQPIPGLTPGKLLSLIEDFCGPGSNKMVVNEVTIQREYIEDFVDYIINPDIPVVTTENPLPGKLHVTCTVQDGLNFQSIEMEEF